MCIARALHVHRTCRYAERALPFGASPQPVPSRARSELFSLTVTAPSDGGAAAGGATSGGGGSGGGPPGCLVKRWGHAWKIEVDRRRYFLAKPPAECLARATTIEDALGDFPQAHGGGKGYSLDAPQVLDAEPKPQP